MWLVREISSARTLSISSLGISRNPTLNWAVLPIINSRCAAGMAVPKLWSGSAVASPARALQRATDAQLSCLTYPKPSDRAPMPQLPPPS